MPKSKIKHTNKSQPAELSSFSKKERSDLIKLARDVIKSKFGYNDIDIPVSLKTIIAEPKGLFVTIYKNDKLRGCIGFSEPIFPLGIALIRAANLAAFEDPRFDPIEENELEQIKIEVSILSKPEQIIAEKPEDYVKKINIGKDGLIVQSNNKSGLLLPQVAVEHNFDAEEFLNQVCIKAGLDKSAWKKKETKILKFQTETIKESESN